MSAIEIKNLPIGKILVESGFINENQLKQALAAQKAGSGKKIGEIVLEMGFVSETQLAHALSIRLKVPYVDLTAARINREAVLKIPEETARKKMVFAFAVHNGKLVVATDDPVNFSIFEELKVKTGMEIIPQLSTRTAIIDAINQYYPEKRRSEPSKLQVSEAPVIKLVNKIIEAAHSIGASDVHIEPFADVTRVRFRVDGELTETEIKIPPAFHNSVISRIKVLAGMDIAEKRLPLDGRFGYSIDGSALEVRVSTLPCVYGEKCVMRLISSSGRARKIKELGMTDYNYELFEKIIRSPSGLILITGPTGSGKSTILYAALEEISRPGVNIVTAEDPVERKLNGINQCQINPKAGMTFAVALKAILRQDPDIIMVGEIRDTETAETTIRAAVTGRLALSSLHTADPASAIVRLMDMGIPPYLIASSVIGIAAQRLVRLLCPECKEETFVSDKNSLALLNKSSPVKIFKPHKGGCKKCGGSGYFGRTGIHEIISVDKEIKSLVLNRSCEEDIRRRAVENGTRPINENAAELVLSGKTSMEELVKIAYS